MIWRRLCHGDIDSSDQIVKLAYSIPGTTALVAVTFAMAMGTVCIEREEDELWKRKVRWGNSGNKEVENSGHIIRHCAVKSLDSGPLTEGFLYR